jgi:hypothetical protein
VHLSFGALPNCWCFPVSYPASSPYNFVGVLQKTYIAKTYIARHILLLGGVMSNLTEMLNKEDGVTSEARRTEGGFYTDGTASKLSLSNNVDSGNNNILFIEWS